jgi:hypothetical protein
MSCVWKPSIHPSPLLTHLKKTTKNKNKNKKKTKKTNKQRKTCASINNDTVHAGYKKLAQKKTCF